MIEDLPTIKEVSNPDAADESVKENSDVSDMILSICSSNYSREKNSVIENLPNAEEKDLNADAPGLSVNIPSDFPNISLSIRSSDDECSSEIEYIKSKNHEINKALNRRVRKLKRGSESILDISQEKSCFVNSPSFQVCPHFRSKSAVDPEIESLREYLTKIRGLKEKFTVSKANLVNDLDHLKKISEENEVLKYKIDEITVNLSKSILDTTSESAVCKCRIILESPRGSDLSQSRFRSNTPTGAAESDLKRLRQSVNEARATLSGKSTPTRNPDLEDTNPIIQENISLRTKIKKLQEAINESQDVKKLELYEKMIKAEIQKRVEIEKHFAQEADQIQIKVSILEEQMKLRCISDEIIGRFLSNFRPYEQISKDGKKVIRKGHGEKVYELIVFYENLIKNLWNDFHVYFDFFEKILGLLSNDSVKAKLAQIESAGQDKTKAKFELIEEQIYSRLEGDKILDDFLRNKMYEALNKEPKAADLLDKGKKAVLKEAFGDKVVGLVDFYEQKLAAARGKDVDKLEPLLDLVLPAEDKARIMSFVREGDLEGAAFVLKDFRNRLKSERSESASKLSAVILKVPEDKKLSVNNRSLTPNRSMRSFSRDKLPEISEKDLIVFLQCQANGLEDLLMNS